MNSIYIYGTIGQDYWGDSCMPASRFVKELNSFGGEDVDVYINSPGGDAFDGSAIYSAISAYPGKVTVHIDGLAASAASFCALSADSVEISPSAMVMIHRAWTHTQGNADLLRDTAEALEKLDETISGIYSRKSGRDASELIDLMSAETWLTAEEAVEMGLCDSLSEDRAIAAHVNKALFSKYKNVPEACNAPRNIEPDEGQGDAPEAHTVPSFEVVNGRIYTR